MEKKIIKTQVCLLEELKIEMIKTILIIILSVTFFGVLFFILVRNALRRKLDILIEEEEKRKLDDLN
jgi:hypothetical protein